jgi:quercetin dioxygenase-like cupin family protein
MSEAPKDALHDDFLRDLEALCSDEGLAADAQQLTAALSAEVPAEAAPGALRGRLLAALDHVSRFERFADAVAQLLDIERSRAEQLLDQLDNRERFYELMPGIELFWVEGGPRVANAVRGFVRVASGLEFPEHEHLGEERVLVLQGSFHDPTRDRTFRPGEISVMPRGSSHLHIVPEHGPDLLMLSVIQDGVTVGEQRYLPNQVPTQG